MFCTRQAFSNTVFKAKFDRVIKELRLLLSQLIFAKLICVEFKVHKRAVFDGPKITCFQVFLKAGFILYHLMRLWLVSPLTCFFPCPGALSWGNKMALVHQTALFLLCLGALLLLVSYLSWTIITYYRKWSMISGG